MAPTAAMAAPWELHREHPAAAMSDRYPVQWTGQLAIVILPHVGESKAGQIRDELLWVINRGATEL